MKNSTAKKYQIAKALLNEVNQYLKTAKVNKIALDTVIDNPDKIKEAWAYWACASLLELQGSGHDMLNNYHIPRPSNTETAATYGARVLRTQEEEGGNLSELLESIWKNGGKASLSAMSSTVTSKFMYWYDGTTYTEKKRIDGGLNNLRLSTPAQSIQWAENWALRLFGHVNWDKTRTKMQPGTKNQPWNRIQKETKKSGNDLKGLVKSVSTAIEKGVYKYILSGTRWRSSYDDLASRNISLDQQDSYGRSRGETTTSGGSAPSMSWEQQSESPLLDLQGDELRIQQLKSEWNDLYWKDAIEELMEDADSSRPDDNPLYRAYVEGEFDSVNAIKKDVRDVLDDYGLLLPADTIEQMKAFIATQQAGGMDDLNEGVRLILARIESESWIEGNVSITASPSTSAEEVLKLAEEAIEGSATQHTSSSDTAQAIADAEKASQELGATILWCESVLDKFQSGDFHWLYDNHLYLEQDWFDFVSKFNAEAMVKMDRLIKKEQNPLIASAFGMIVNRKSLMSIPRLKKIKKFVDDCMDQKVVKAEINQKAVLSWYLSLSIAIDPLTVQTINGPLTIANVDLAKGGQKVQWTGKVVMGMFGLICEALRTQNPSQTQDMYKKLQSRIDEIVPDAGGLPAKFQDVFNTWIKVSDKVLETRPPRKLTDSEKEGLSEAEIEKQENKFWRATNAWTGRKMWADTRGSMRDGKALTQADGWFGVIVSELVRYRYYLDLGYDQVDLNNPLIPISIGNADCDNNVRSLIGKTPEQCIHRTKESSLEHGVEGWAEDFVKSLKGLLKIKRNNFNKINVGQQKLMKTLGVDDWEELFALYVEASKK